MTPTQKRRANRAIKQHIERFEAAVEANSWRGGGDPEDIPYKELEYKQAKSALRVFMRLAVEGKMENNP